MKPTTAFVAAFLGLVVPAGAPLHGQSGPAVVDWWNHASLGPHVDTYAGEIAIWFGAAGRVVVAIDEDEHTSEPVTGVSRLFVFESERATGEDREISDTGVVRYWHDGMRISLSASGEVIELRLAHTEAPRPSRRWAKPTATITGYGLMLESSESWGDVSLEEALELAVDGSRDVAVGLVPPTENPDPGGGAEGTCASSCSVGCEEGQCQVSCSGPYCASCRCQGGRSWCTCTAKR
jgi:hypothetical protein